MVDQRIPHDWAATEKSKDLIVSIVRRDVAVLVAIADIGGQAPAKVVFQFHGVDLCFLPGKLILQNPELCPRLNSRCVEGMLPL